MPTSIDRRTFLRRAGLAGGLTLAGPLQAYAARTATGAPVSAGGYGPLVDMGDLALPRGFTYSVVSRAGDTMSDGNPTPGVFDGTGSYPGAGGTTILVRNHENRRRAGETAVVVPDDLRYDPDPSYNAGNTKLVVDGGGHVLEQFAILGGTSTNCAGGVMPWGSWIACEEVFDQGAKPHGYAFEIDAYASGPVKAEPIRGAGRFVQEACVWVGGALYLTEDRGLENGGSRGACLYRYVPGRPITGPGQLAQSSGVLQALKLTGWPGGVTTANRPASVIPVDTPLAVEWVTIDVPEPPDNGSNSTRAQGAAKGAARFSRQEGAWAVGTKVYFDCTDGGPASLGQIWELDVEAQTLRLIYESDGPEALKNPDNLVVVPRTGDLILCEDADEPMFLRGLTTDGGIYDFARAISIPDTEFCGACFDPRGNVLYVSQQGGRPEPSGVTYAIRGPWKTQRAR